MATPKAQQVSAAGVLSFCMCHADKVITRPDLAFVPKANAVFHQCHELALPLFCLTSTWLCVGKQILTRSLRRTASYFYDLWGPFVPEGNLYGSNRIPRVHSCLAAKLDCFSSVNTTFVRQILQFGSPALPLTRNT